MSDETVEMTDQTTAGQDPAPEATGQPVANSVNDPSAQEPEDDFDKERALTTIRKLRETEKASKAQAQQLKELQAKLTEYEDAKLTEQERLAKQFETLQAQLAEKERVALDYERTLQEQAVQFKVFSAATQLNIVDPEAAYKLLDLSQIEYDEGKPTNVDKVLKELVKAKPYLVQQQAAPPANPTNPSRTDRQAAADPVNLPFGRQQLNIWDLGKQGAMGGGIVYAGEHGNE